MAIKNEGNEWQVQWRDVNELAPYAKNARLNEKTVPYLKNSIQRFGFRVPLVIGPNGEIVCGHTRLVAALELGMGKVPCVPAEDLTEEERRAFRLADNKIQEFSEWSGDLLDEELLELGKLGFDMDEFGFGDLGKDWGQLDDVEGEQAAPTLEGANNVVKVVVPASVDEDALDEIREAVKAAVERWPGCEVS